MGIFPALAVTIVAAGASVTAQSRADSASTAPNGRYVAIGCLTRQGTAAAPRFVLTDPRGEKPTTYRVQGDAAQLAAHVGHTVELAGTLTAPATPAGQYVLKTSSLAWLASSCTTSTGRTGVRP